MRVIIDGIEVDVEPNSTLYQLSKKSRKRDVLIAKINGKLYDLSRAVGDIAKEGDVIEFLTFDDKEGKEVFWHSTSHLLAAAVKKLYPDALPTIGPPIDEGFYYDFYNLKIGDSDLPKLEEEVKKLVKDDVKFERIELTKEQAREMFKDNKFKLEIIEESNEALSAYRDGPYVDLCRGPHIPSSGYIKAVKLLKLSGSYWRGDSKRETLTRIYGISFPKESLLKEYLQILEERKRRDHKVIGKELELFMFTEISPGSPFILPDGFVVYNELLQYARELDKKHGYMEVMTPFIGRTELWKKTGHLEKYRENMYEVVPFSDENDKYVLKPMNCPFHIAIFNAKTRSYRDLPFKLSEFGIVHRYELEGTLDGLLRTRVLQQNDAHVFVSEEQIEDIVSEIIEMMNETFRLFDMKPIFVLATRPEKRIGSDELWDKAENALRNVLEKIGVNFTVKEGDGAFYGPKIDVYVLDFTGKPEYAYAVSTVQLDFNLAGLLGAKYMGKDDREHVPIIIHRAILGSIGRFMGIVLEHTAGNLPLWLTPIQVVILPVSKKYEDFANSIAGKMRERNIRVTIDGSESTLEYRIRNARLKRIPYIIVVGEKEMNEGTLTVRVRGQKDLIKTEIEKFVEKIEYKIHSRSMDLSLN
ncbi:threonine--tRNA ligase [Sulfolobales archaeon HS-7]|nr:threonine--tRNA ligase [Sulfolobales archaeon HS-7]